MATTIYPCNFTVRTLEPGLEAASEAYCAMQDLDIEVTQPFGPAPDGKYLFHVTGVPAEWINTTPWADRFGVEVA